MLQWMRETGRPWTPEDVCKHWQKTTQGEDAKTTLEQWVTDGIVRRRSYNGLTLVWQAEALSRNGGNHSTPPKAPSSSPSSSSPLSSSSPTSLHQRKGVNPSPAKRPLGLWATPRKTRTFTSPLRSTPTTDPDCVPHKRLKSKSSTPASPSDTRVDQLRRRVEQLRNKIQWQPDAEQEARLDGLAEKWRSACQEILLALQEKVYADTGQRARLGDIVTGLRIEHDLISYDPDTDEFM